MRSNVSAKMCAHVSREQAGNEIGHALRQFIGRGREYSVKEAALATGVSARMIECAMAQGYDHRPLPDWALLSLMKLLGPAFTNAWLGLAGQCAVRTGTVDHDGLAAECIDFAAEHARARHPASPEGIRIAPCEDLTLRAKRPTLVLA